MKQDTEEFFITPMQPEHIQYVVAIHLQSFPGFFLTFLGPRFLRLLYSEILNTADHVALVAQDHTSSITGFVVGVCHQSGFYTSLARRRWLAFAIASLGAAISSPSIIPRLVRALSYPSASRSAASQALLMSIAVAPNAAGRGIGQQLVMHFLSTMKQENVTSVSLTSDRDANERTNRFYQRLGFRVDRTYVTPEGRWMNEYIIDLSNWTPLVEAN